MRPCLAGGLLRRGRCQCRRCHCRWCHCRWCCGPASRLPHASVGVVADRRESTRDLRIVNARWWLVLVRIPSPHMALPLPPPPLRLRMVTHGALTAVAARTHTHPPHSCTRTRSDEGHDLTTCAPPLGTLHPGGLPRLHLHCASGVNVAGTPHTRQRGSPLHSTARHVRTAASPASHRHTMSRVEHRGTRHTAR